MASWAHRCEVVWSDSLLAAVIIVGCSTLAMIQTRQPARRRTWGRLGLIASLAVIPLVALGPLPRVNLKHPSRIIWGASSRFEPAPDPSRLLVDSAGLSEGEEVDPGGGVAGPRPMIGWGEVAILVLIIVHLLGTVVELGRIGLGLIGTSRLLARSAPASRAAELLLESLPFAGRGRRPRVMSSPHVGRPVLVGPVRPVILIPPGFDEPGMDGRLRLGLLHELAHAEQGDHAFGLVASLAHACWFFLPPVWWIRNQLRLDAEFLADHRAVDHYGTSFGYAESLVRLASGAGDIGLAPTPVPSSARLSPSTSARPSRPAGLASALIQRVQMLLTCPFEVEDQPPRAWTLLVWLALTVLTLVACCLTIRDDHDRPLGAIKAVGVAQHGDFYLEDLVIAPPAVADRPFDLRFPLPEQFRLSCEVYTTPDGLGRLEILGYLIGPIRDGQSRDIPGWWKVEIVRSSGGKDTVRIDGRELDARPPARPADWLAIKPDPLQQTRIRNLRLTW